MARSALGASASYTSLMDDKQKVDVALTGEEEHDCEHRVPLKEDARGVYCPICGEGVACPTGPSAQVDNQAARP